MSDQLRPVAVLVTYVVYVAGISLLASTTLYHAGWPASHSDRIVLSFLIASVVSIPVTDIVATILFGETAREVLSFADRPEDGDSA